MLMCNARDIVSVVIPVYNAEKVISKCIESYINQSYKDIEIIIIDDGSTDQSLEIIKKYQVKDERIKIICQSHRGVSVARNQGIKIANGKYITFCDSDDYAEISLIDEYLNARCFAEQNAPEYSFIMSGMHVDVLSGTMEDRDNLLEDCDKYCVLENNKIAYLCWLNLFNFVTNKFYELDRIKKNHIRFVDSVQIGEDLKFNLDYLKVSDGPMLMVNLPLYHYVRYTDHSLSLVYYENAVNHTRNIYDELLDFAIQQQGTTTDDIMIIKSIYLVDWTSRLTALYMKQDSPSEMKKNRRMVKIEIQAENFQRLLKEVYACRKVSFLRYSTLRMKNYGLYCFFRKIYRFLK